MVRTGESAARRDGRGAWRPPSRRFPLVFLGLWCALWPARVTAQFAPGKLSKVHADLSGLTDCFQCHEPRKATTSDRCLRCHRELGTRIAARAGYHGRLPQARLEHCGDCHREHGGEAASIISWPDGRDGFDHRRTGFTLEGRHASLRCDDCHKPELIRARDVRRSKTISPQRTHLGLGSRCADCHAEPHHGQFESQLRGGDCSLCHAQTTWKVERFAHEHTRFALEGKHGNLACDRCHPRVNEAGTPVGAGAPGSFVRYRPVPFETCKSCHKDPHEGRHGSQCASCHSPHGWRDLSLARFDHSKTRFPLQGKHTQVACDRCHWSEDAAGKRVAKGTEAARIHWKPIPFQQCTGCHRDVHQNRLGADCTRCHSPAGWSSIRKGTFDHDRTRYPLRGRHRDVACAKCHRKDREGRQTMSFAACTDCHADAHRGQLAQRPDRGACESCHGVEGFVPARFGAEEHENTRFPLRDAHLAVACSDCHRPNTSGFVMQLEKRNCTDCHRDPHGGQFARAGQTDCARCHDGRSWQLQRFDHSKTRFPLDGAHIRAACSACHRQKRQNGQVLVHYTPLDTACRSCHAPKK